MSRFSVEATVGADRLISVLVPQGLHDLLMDIPIPLEVVNLQTDDPRNAIFLDSLIEQTLRFPLNKQEGERTTGGILDWLPCHRAASQGAFSRTSSKLLTSRSPKL